jgi:cation diffusion facilitator family transporter
VSHDDGNAGWRPQVPGGNQLDAAARGESAGEPVSGGQAGMGSDSRTAVIASIAANVAIALTKFVVAIVSRSAAMFAEAIHSLVNCFDGTLLLLGAWRAKRPPDELHPFGHGRELYFWNLIVAIIFFALGSGFTIYEGVRRTLAPEPLGAARWSYIVLAASALFDGTSFVIGFRRFRRTTRGRSYWATIRQSKNPALFSVVLEDTADLIGLSVAALGVFLSHALGDARIDGIASIAIGLVLGAVAAVLLIGESAAPELIEAVRAAAAGDSDVAHVEEMLTVQLGPSDVVVALRVVLRADLQAHEVTAATSRIEDRIRHEHGDVKRVFVELSAAERDGARQARGT